MPVTIARFAEAFVSDDTVKSNAEIARTKLDLDELAAYPYPLENLRVWDAYATVLPGTSSGDDLGLYGGTFTSGSQLVRSYDIKGLTTTLYARGRFIVPIEYQAGETITVRFHCGMVTTVAGTSCTIDLQAYIVDGEGGIGSDLCATAAQSMNSLTYADKDFTITPNSVTPGDVFDFRIAINSVDAVNSTAVIAAIGSIDWLMDVRG